VTGQVSLQFEKGHAATLKRLGYRRHPKGAGWVRPVKRAWFPRFHLYTNINWQTKAFELDLHLDYEREDIDARMPTASAESPQVATEMQRILATFKG
jgi:hypothetical protein